MKYLVLLFFTFSVVLGEETISFSTNSYTSLYKSSYTYSYKFDYKYTDSDWDYKDYNRDNKYHYDHPSIPEPSSWSLLIGMCALSSAFIWRLKKARSKS